MSAAVFIFDTSAIKQWGVARKTKGLRAKPIVSLIVDKSVMSSFLIDTLEGREPIAPENVFCIGEGGDAWQQSPKKLLDKYTVDKIDGDGWMHCVPKPENSVEFYIVADDITGYVQGHWGATIEGIPNLQEFTRGDAIVRNRTDPTDVWIVRRKIWLNTYTEITS
jgi:hypothetical protein